MKIWNKILNENENRTVQDHDVAWTYKDGIFSDHQSIQHLADSNFDAIILRQGAKLTDINLALFDILPCKHFHLLIRKSLDQEVQFFLKNYWTLIMYIKLNNTDTPFVIVHMASSLDGKIATNSGHSKWIGNQENLIHAHRIRAIVDGILIGSRTMKNDSPKLTVRHVEGKNPTRMILSNSTTCFNDLAKVEDCDTYLLRNKENQKEDYNYPFEKVIYFESETVDSCPLKALMQELKSLKINSILIEGGTTTVSNFIKSGLVSVFQVHLAPLLLGSGKASLVLPEIQEINEGLTMKYSFYTPMGDSMMITGCL